MRRIPSAIAAVLAVLRGRRRRLLCGLCAGLLLAAAGASAQTAGEFEVKAAFLLKFAHYVDWPPQALAPGSPLRVCVLGEDPFGAILEGLLAAQTGEPRLSLQRPESARQAAASCQIVFIRRRDRQALRRDLALLRDSPVLTVGESPEFAAEGGVIAFRVEHNRVRLVINLAAANRAGLKISSRLLAIATVWE